MRAKKLFKLSLLAAACATAMTSVQADTITGIQDTSVGTQSPVVQAYDFSSLTQFGFGGWNIGTGSNVSVKIIDSETGEEVTTKSFDQDSGLYSAMVEGETFASFINNGVDVTTPTAKLI